MRAAVVFAAAVAVDQLLGLGLAPERVMLILLAPAIVLGCARRYLLDWVPFGALLAAYALLRGFANVLRPDPYFLPQLKADRFLFGGDVPAAVLQHWFWDGGVRWYDHLVLIVKDVHLLVPLTLAFVLWLRRRALFYRFAATLLLLSFAAAVTFLIFPAAPPWAAADDGLLQVTRIGGGATTASAGNGVYSMVHANPYAAIPSLHAGYAVLVFLFAAGLAWRRGRRLLAAAALLYPLAQSFAVVYTGNHYVVDLLIGGAYAGASFVAVRVAWSRLRLPE